MHLSPSTRGFWMYVRNFSVKEMILSIENEWKFSNALNLSLFITFSYHLVIHILTLLTLSINLFNS